ncbi:ABC transporter ATP-binding protein [Inquilinus limosus]|uniref:Methionine ABC transporter ATP-binding protein n=1 Tax=Inquilinus limosus TaxID=171674 RepID=A0A211ZP89_9PROT|nr:ABC transporter ATP-binding protein [Inquilinus limosus]OWJ67059.1 methionine ABC transporter ATP-binding protein [Inquilinus limosus]
MTAPLLDVRDLSVAATRDGVEAILVDRVSFSLEAGQVMGLVGESGSGKSVTCRALIGLLPGGLHIAGGSVLLKGRNLTALGPEALRRVRGREIGMIFQNPSSHLDPVMRIGDQIAEGIRLHRGASKREARSAAVELLRQVGIPDPERRAGGYPHEFSGGMRQRAMIATALACDPEVLIADEPTTALDVTVQAQILRLLLELRDRRGLAIILITHDLGVVAQSCDRVAVMYGGTLCEAGGKRAVLAAPRHPYTARLIACQPASHADGGHLLPFIPGQPPALADLPTGCRFHPRCDRAFDRCKAARPEPSWPEPGHMAACHRALGDAA